MHNLATPSEFYSLYGAIFDNNYDLTSVKNAINDIQNANSNNPKINNICHLLHTIYHLDTYKIEKIEHSKNIIFSSDQLNWLAEWAELLEQGYMLGKVADLLWVSKVKHTKAPFSYLEIIINSYINLPFYDDNYNDNSLYWQRAHNLSNTFRQLNLYETVTNKFWDLFEEIKNIDSVSRNRLVVSIVDLRLYLSKESFVKDIENIAHEYKVNNVFHILEHIYNHILCIFTQTQNLDKLDFYYSELATMHEKHADSRASQGGVAQHFYGISLTYYKKIRKSFRHLYDVNSAIQRVTKKLHTSGKKVIEQMHTLSLPAIDISEYQEQAVKEISASKNLEDALFRLSNIFNFSYVKYQKNFFEINQKSFFRTLFGITLQSNEGKAADLPPLVNAPSSSVYDNPNFDRLAYELHTHIEFHIRCYFYPALSKIREDYNIHFDSILELVSQSALIPKDRLNTVSQAIHLGLNEQFHIAIQLITPFIEFLVNDMLRKEDVETQFIDANCNITTPSLNSLLKTEKIINLLDEDTYFLIKALFVTPSGANLRNKVAHGQISDNSQYDPSIMYVWWWFFNWILKLAAVQEEDGC